MRPLVLVAALVLLPACAARSRPGALPGPEASPAEGRTSVRILNPASANPEPDSKVTVVAAEAGPENQLPEYPARALAADCGSGRVAVRIRIATTGRVQLQGDVPGRAVPSDACHQEFAGAVRETVQKWGFFPAMRRVCGDGASDCTSTPVPISLDLEFLFEVVGGKGRVRSE